MNDHTNQRASKRGLNLNGCGFFSGKSSDDGDGGECWKVGISAFRVYRGVDGWCVVVDGGMVLFSVGFDEAPPSFLLGSGGGRRVWSFESKKGAKPFGCLTHEVGLIEEKINLMVWVLKMR